MTTTTVLEYTTGALYFWRPTHLRTVRDRRSHIVCTTKITEKIAHDDDDYSIRICNTFLLAADAPATPPVECPEEAIARSVGAAEQECPGVERRRGFTAVGMVAPTRWSSAVSVVV